MSTEFKLTCQCSSYKLKVTVLLSKLMIDFSILNAQET